MSLMSISLAQTVHLWSELEQAFHGTNRYRHNAAEIWIHNLMPASPAYEEARYTVEHSDWVKAHIESIESAAMSAFYDVLTLFAHSRNADIVINGRPLGKWVKRVRRMTWFEVQVVSRDARIREELMLRGQAHRELKCRCCCIGTCGHIGGTDEA